MTCSRHPAAVLSVLLPLVACGGGPPGPPALEHALPTTQAVVYDYENDAVIRVSLMGQNLQVSQEGDAELAVRFSETSGGVGVTLEVRSLAATLRQPMGAPLQVDEGAVQGPLAFTLDRLGRATVSQQPEVRPEASQMISPLGLAHTFFPTLPGRAVMPGERWVDTVSFEGPGGDVAEESVFTYTVLGDTVVDRRALLRIGLQGHTESRSTLDVGGMAVRQTSELDVTGHVLWDYQAGLMMESSQVGTGSGTVSIPIAPAPLPITIETTRRARLRAGGS